LLPHIAIQIMLILFHKQFTFIYFPLGFFPLSYVSSSTGCKSHFFNAIGGVHRVAILGADLGL
jgi:hypothetical protein